MVKLTIGGGSGQEFRVTAERRDGFEGAIRIELGGLPEGMSSTSPLTRRVSSLPARWLLLCNRYRFVASVLGCSQPISCRSLFLFLRYLGPCSSRPYQA